MARRSDLWVWWLVLAALLVGCAASPSTSSPTSPAAGLAPEPTSQLIPDGGLKVEGAVPHDYTEESTQTGVEKNGSFVWQKGDADLAKDDALWVFGYADWEFLPDGTCRFTPPFHLRYDTKLYPLVGRWKQADNRLITFEVKSSATTETVEVTMSVVGSMEVPNLVFARFDKKVIRLDENPRTAATYTATIRQRTAEKKE